MKLLKTVNVMSESEIKIGLRAEVKHLNGKSIEKIHEYFANRDVYPVEYEEDVLFYEATDSTDFVPYITNNKVYLDYIFANDETVDFTTVNFPAGLIGNLVSIFSSRFGVPRHDVEFYAYQWYNGTDDPIIDW